MSAKTGGEATFDIQRAAPKDSSADCVLITCSPAERCAYKIASLAIRRALLRLMVAYWALAYANNPNLNDVVYPA